MPAENKTPHIGLNQWQGNEYLKRQDFVDDNLKIDTAIKTVDEKIDNIDIPEPTWENLQNKPTNLETTEGSQSKADEALTSANQYTDQEVDALAGEENEITVKDLHDQSKSHWADYVQQLGTAELATVDKTLKGAINEVFTSGNNVKSDTVTALLSVDDALPITTEDSWNEIIAQIANIITGKKWASGTLLVGGMEHSGGVLVANLPFTPSVLIVENQFRGTTGIRFKTYAPSETLYQASIVGGGTTSGNITKFSIEGNNIVYNESRSLLIFPDDTLTYIAIE